LAALDSQTILERAQTVFGRNKAACHIPVSRLIAKKDYLTA